jgi:hypothetical protein
VVPASIELRDDLIVWDSKPGHLCTREPELWSRFLALAEAPNERIVQYARRWGPLGPCENHDLPSGHPTVYASTRGAGVAILVDNEASWQEFRPPARRKARGRSRVATDTIAPRAKPDHSESTIELVETYFGACPPKRLDTGRHAEPVEAWKRWATRVTSLLSVVRALDRGFTPSSALWQTATDWNGMSFRRHGSAPPYTAPAQGWKQVAATVDDWLTLGHVRVVSDVARGKPVLELGGGELFGAIALQLALAVVGMDGFAVCSSCGRVGAEMLSLTVQGQML